MKSTLTAKSEANKSLFMLKNIYENAKQVVKEYF